MEFFTCDTDCRLYPCPGRGKRFHHLFNTILINVTAFLRDGAPWDVLRTTLIPKLLEARGQDGAIRIWSAACASGEETYTVAMLFAEALGPEAFGRGVRIYTTDVDDERSATRGRRSTRGQASSTCRRISSANTSTNAARVQELQQQLSRSKQDLESTYEELQSTNEELDTTNEELQSTVEELETTNEELQSINRELRACLSGENELANVTVDAINRRGKPVRCTVTCTPLFGKCLIRGVIVMVDEEAPA